MACVKGVYMYFLRNMADLVKFYAKILQKKLYFYSDMCYNVWKIIYKKRKTRRTDYEVQRHD